MQKRKNLIIAGVLAAAGVLLGVSLYEWGRESAVSDCLNDEYFEYQSGPIAHRFRCEYIGVNG